MRKTTLLALATAALALVTVVTNLIRAEAGPITKQSAAPVVQVQGSSGLKVTHFNAI
jgi:hypothetical protein